MFKYLNITDQVNELLNKECVLWFYLGKYMSRKSGSGLELSESLGFWDRTWFCRGGLVLGLCFPACLPYPSLMAPSVILRDPECLTAEILAHTSKSGLPLLPTLQMAAPQPVLEPRACTLVTWSGLCME